MQSANAGSQGINPARQIDFDSNATVIKLVERNAREDSSRVAIKEKDLGIWQEYTWQDYLDNAVYFAAGLESIGFQAEETLLLIGDNRPQLYFGTVGVSALRGNPMPAYPDASPDEVLHFAQNSGARYAFVEDQEQVDKLLDLREKIGTLEYIIYSDERGLASYKDKGLMPYDLLITKGRELTEKNPALYDEIINRARPEDTAIFVHSSGTTGKPKGVILKNRNVLGGVKNGYEGYSLERDEVVMGYLPMAWIGDYAFTVAAGVALRWTLCIPEQQETLLRDMREIAPTFYLAAPRSWDNMLTNIQVGMQDSPWLKKTIYNYFMDFGFRVEKKRFNDQSPSFLDKIQKVIGEFLVYGPVKDAMGLSRIRTAYTGGEAMGEDTFLFYRSLGVALRQLYGQTESSAFNSTQSKDEVRLHTVGKPLPGVDIKIDDSGEILLKSASNFEGYYKNEKATAEALVDGWLLTGDAGYLEEDGHIVVLGRLSEVVYTAGGERFIPNYIENRIKFSPFVKDIAVLGRDRDELCAMACIDIEAAGNWAELEGISYISYADLSQKPEIYNLVSEAIAHVNETLPDPLKIKRFTNLHKEFDPDDGEITRTRKLKRKVVEERYVDVIDALYSGEKSVVMKAQITYDSGDTGVIERNLSIREV